VSNKPKDSGTESNNTEAKNIDQLLKEGISAAKSGDKATARAKLREVVAADQYSEKGWFWLASVVESEEERRVCLGNVVVINPENRSARETLDRLNNLNPRDSKMRRPKGGPADWTSVISGEDGEPPKRDRRLLLIIGVLVIAAVLLVVLSTQGGGAPATPTQVAGSGDSVSEADLKLTEAILNVTATAEMLKANEDAATHVAATATAGRKSTLASLINATMPPSWTPRPTATIRGTLTATPLASPPAIALAGRLVTSHGKKVTEDGNLPLFLLDLSSNQDQPITAGDRGNSGILSPDGTQLIYARFLSGSRPQTLLRLAPINGLGTPEEVSALWGNTPPLSDQQMAAISRDGQYLAFSARSVATENERTWAIYVLPIKLRPPGPTPTATATASDTPTASPTRTLAAEATEQPTSTITPTMTPTVTRVPLQVKRLTKLNDGFNFWPDFSADGQYVVYAREERNAEGQTTAADLFLISVKGGGARNLTNDGALTLESMPRFSPDGKSIVFVATRQGQTNRELFIMNSDGSNRRVLEPESKGDNQRPVWSPDGKFIAFTSNRSGKDEIFIIEADGKQLYQLTSSADPVYVMDWVK